jgi:dienelactone hydrolase
MGGMLALELWRQAPQRVRGMALLGSTARADTPELLALREQACALFAAGRMEEVLRANVLFAFHPLHARPPGLVDSYLAMLRRAGAGQLMAQNRAVMARVDSRPTLPTVTCPLLLACGEADQLTPPDHSREMAALASGAQLEIVPGAGHMLTMEQPARVGTLLLDWLARHSVRPPKKKYRDSGTEGEAAQPAPALPPMTRGTTTLASVLTSASGWRLPSTWSCMHCSTSALRWRAVLARTSSSVIHSVRTMPVSSTRPGSGSPTVPL